MNWRPPVATITGQWCPGLRSRAVRLGPLFVSTVLLVGACSEGGADNDASTIAAAREELPHGPTDPVSGQYICLCIYTHGCILSSWPGTSMSST